VLEEVPSLCDEQAIIAFFSPFMSTTSGAMLSETLREAPCVLVENVPMDVGEMFVKKLGSLGAQVAFRTSNGNTRLLCMDRR
jgi:hypothetical protein